MSVGMREIIWILIGVLAIYVAVQLLRIGRRPQAGRAPDPQTEVAPDLPPVVNRSAVESAAPVPAPPPRDETRARAEQTALELEVQQLRRDIGQLRAEQEKQRRESLRLADEFGRLQEATATLQAGQRISPQYGEAVMLARRGLESEAIAERCGISVAEAALVRSLAHGKDIGENDVGS